MQKDNYKSFYDKLNLRFQLMAGLSIFFFIPCWMYVESINSETGNGDLSTNQNIGLLYLLLTIALIAFWHYQFHKDCKKIEKQDDLDSRLEDFKRLFILLIFKMLLLSTLVSISYLFIRNDIMIGAYSFLLVMISMNRLTHQKVARNTKMSKEEREVFFDSQFSQS